jgi:hypothetical protein
MSGIVQTIKYDIMSNFFQELEHSNEIDKFFKKFI